MTVTIMARAIMITPMTITVMPKTIIITPKVAVTAMTTTPSRNLLPESAWALA